MLDRKNFEKPEIESLESLCYTGMPEWFVDRGVDRTTKTEVCENNWVRRIT